MALSSKSTPLYIGAVTSFDSYQWDNVVGQVDKYCNHKIIVCTTRHWLTATYWQFKSLGIDKCPYKIPRTEWMDELPHKMATWP